MQRSWYSKLKEEGFLDREQEENEGSISSFVPFVDTPMSELKYSTRLDYFLCMSQWIEQEEFQNPRDKIIMFMRSEGFQIKEIVDSLKSQGYSCHRQTIRFIIRKFENKWKIRLWEKKQMTSNLVT